MRSREPKARNARPPNAIRAYVERPMHFPTAMHGCARLRRVWRVRPKVRETGDPARTKGEGRKGDQRNAKMRDDYVHTR